MKDNEVKAISYCDICGPEFVGECPHKLSVLEMVNAVSSWRSDDFGHDCTSLLEAESRALQDVCDKFIELLARANKLEDMLTFSNRTFDFMGDKSVQLQYRVQIVPRQIEKNTEALKQFAAWKKENGV